MQDHLKNKFIQIDEHLRWKMCLTAIQLDVNIYSNMILTSEKFNVLTIYPTF